MLGIGRLLAYERIVAKSGYNRWRVVPAALGIHLCIGSVYAWSVFNGPLTRQLGVVVPAAEDWSFSLVNLVFSVAILFLGLSAAFAGRWVERVGPRKVGIVAALCWGGGFLISGIGIASHQVWLLYLGYGVLGGCGLGLGYVSPVGTLIRWFPDRRGMATGLAIMGFGGGAIIGAPLKEALLTFFYRAPTYLGSTESVELITKASRRYVMYQDSSPEEVVVLGINEAAKLIVPAEPGVYLLGTGSSGAAATFITLGLIYLTIMGIAAFLYRVPPKGWVPENWGCPYQHRYEDASILSTLDYSLLQRHSRNWNLRGSKNHDDRYF